MIISIHSQNKAWAANKTLILANIRLFCLHRESHFWNSDQGNVIWMNYFGQLRGIYWSILIMKYYNTLISFPPVAVSDLACIACMFLSLVLYCMNDMVQRHGLIFNVLL